MLDTLSAGQAVLVCSILLYFGTRIIIATTRWRPQTLPPGPLALPIIGNLHQFPLKDLHIGLEKLAKRYGSLVCMKAGVQNFMLINDARVVKELIEKRSSVYSTRPDWYIRNFNGNMNIAFRDNDEIWRRMRKMYHLRLNLQVSNRYVPYQEFDSIQLLNDMIESPVRFSDHLQRYTTSVASTILYGWRTPSSDLPYVKDLIMWMDLTSAAANLQLVDFFPIMRPLYAALPLFLSPYKRSFAKIKAVEDRLFFTLLHDAKTKLKEGRAHPSFVRDMLQSDDEDKLSDLEIAHQAAHGFGAGSDTQWNTLLSFIKTYHALLLYPDVQRRAQAEIDEVVGASRLPLWSDRKSLPFVRSVNEETLRWMPTTLSAAVPHANSRDDDFEGLFIPGGSTMMMNVWTLNNSTAVGDPREFDPDQHSASATAKENYGIDPDSIARKHFTFGAGRRVCPGYHVAARGLFIAASRLLWAFNFTRAKDPNGNIVPIGRDDLTPGLIVRPIPYPCDIKTRSSERDELIRNTWKDAQQFLDAEGNFTPSFINDVFAKNQSMKDESKS